MAISYVGGTANSAINGNDVTLDLSGIGLQENDVVVLAYGVADESGAPSGWTNIATNGVTNTQEIRYAYKVMTATPDSSVTCEQGPSAGTTFHAISAACIAFRGVDTSNVLDVAVTGANHVPGTPDPPSITPVTAGAVVVAISSLDTNDTSVGTIDGYSNTQTAAGDDTFPSTTAMAWKAWSGSGAEDPGAWSTFGSGTGGSLSIALRPAADTAVLPNARSKLTILGFRP